MRTLVGPAVIVGTLVAAFSPVGVARAAPSGPEAVDEVINQLQSQGYHVILNRVGSAPLDRCSVRGVRRGQTYSRSDSGVPGAGTDLVTTVTGMTVFVDVDC
ncbi:hypothetical protein JOF57_004222 [Mycolicibacterium lutetiense]|uniref:PASTA domain-containing protein n=1 Tax=Mycolicibacterium lutetiense TaxID=1641992 RepID=A0ABS4ZXS0_9MYCO|nr:hypothetical protein [Mycolicibacterium lutetiense]